LMFLRNCWNSFFLSSCIRICSTWDLLKIELRRPPFLIGEDSNQPNFFLSETITRGLFYWNRVDDKSIVINLVSSSS
jgi:hypothetical protein